MPFIPDASTLAAYTLASIILFATPGPDMSLFLARTIAGGRVAGIASMAGSSFGCLVHTALAAVGLSALIAASPAAFSAVKIGGALYLLWLAFDAIRNGSALNPSTDGKPPASLMRTFLLGVMVNLTNPKVVLFFVTFLPQFVSADDPHAPSKLAFLGVYMLIVTFPLAVLMILGAERVVGSLRRRPRVMRGIDYVFAGFFGAFAVRTLLTEGR
ncbi:MAG: LysE family translocator [Beijerinckiaceae bacterium]